MEETKNNTTITNNKENVIDSSIDEDSLTKPKKKYSYYVKKAPDEDKRKIKERTPKQLEALKKGRDRVQERTMKKKEETIQKYLAEQDTLKQSIAKENEKKSDEHAYTQVQKFSDSESDESSSSEEEIIVKSKKKKSKIQNNKQKKRKSFI